MKKILLDTGPLVAVIAKDDQHHQPCTEVMKSITVPRITTWAVLTEAAWLLKSNPMALKRLLESEQAGYYALASIGAEALPWLGSFLHRYRKLGAQLADATLVYLAERDGIDTVFTLDRRDFSVYRFGKSRSFKLIPESD